MIHASVLWLVLFVPAQHCVDNWRARIAHDSSNQGCAVNHIWPPEAPPESRYEIFTSSAAPSPCYTIYQSSFTVGLMGPAKPKGDGR